MNADYYAYDFLNRLSAVQENQNNNGAETTAYRQQNTFDRWGNRTIDQTNTWNGAVWSEDAVPTGAVAVGDADGWNWVTSNPTPYTGASSHQSANAAGVHQHYFYGATTTLTPAAGENLYAWVYLDPTSPPTEVMLQWNNGNWEHRAYWGADQIGWGTNGTDSRRYVGALPATGGWVKLEVPASSVGLVGQAINGMAFSLFGGKATWDRAGKTPAAGSINQDKYTVNAANNRFTELNYDTAGNVVGEKLNLGNRMEYKYDAENHVIAAGINFVTNNTAPTSQYFYDANGKRTRKLVSGVETWFVYGIDGELVAEYNANGAVGSPQKEYGYRSGQLLVVFDNTEPLADKKLQWLVADHLGTPRMVIDKTGSLSGLKRHDYLPFGEEIGANVGIRSAGNGFTADQVKQKFTGKRRDDETNLDFFEARYFSSIQGRFTSPDEFTGGATELFAEVAAHNPTFYAELAEPQSLNKYTYCLNNPYKYVDPDGHQQVVADFLNSAGQAAQGAGPYGQAAAKVFFVVGAAAAIAANTSWEDVKSAAKTVLSVAHQDPYEHLVQEMSKNDYANSQGQPKPKGSQNPVTAEAAAEGRKQHEAFKEKVKAKPDWQSEPSLVDPKTGKTVKPDAVTPSGRPVELKPNTPSGRAKGASQIKGQERATGKKGRVVYYEPKKKKTE